MVRTLLAKGAEVNAKTRAGLTPLMLATLRGKPDVVQALLANGADVNATTNSGVTALMLVSMLGHADVLEMLLAHGADVNAKTDVGVTALMWASQLGLAKPTAPQLFSRDTRQIRLDIQNWRTVEHIDTADSNGGAISSQQLDNRQPNRIRTAR